MIKWQEKLGSIHWDFFFLIASEKYPPFTDLGVVLFKWDDVVYINLWVALTSGMAQHRSHMI